MTLKFSSAVIALSIALSGCTTNEMPPPIETAKDAQSQPAILNYAAGEVLSYVVITSRDTDEARAARETYYESAFPLAEQFGLKRGLSLSIPTQFVGKDKAHSVAVFSYPNLESADALSAHAEWPSIKSLRPKAWDELAIFTKELEEPLQVQFSPSKIYTLAVAELNSDAPEDYNTYMRGIEPGLNAMGGRFLYRMINPTIESHRHTYDPLVQVTLVEWDTAEALANFTNSPGYKAYSKYFASGVTGFSFFQVRPVAQPS